MRAEADAAPDTPTTAKSPWLSLNDGTETVILDDPGADTMYRPQVSAVGIADELDSTTYGYALRVAYINNILRRNNASGATSPISPRLQTPSSATGSPTSYFPYSGPTTPGAASPSATTPTSEAPHRKSGLFARKKSVSNLRDRDPSSETTRTADATGGKLPKEILSNGFWDTLANEGGDVIWRTTVNTLLSHLPNKKATKTNSGTNLRFVPSLIDAFTNAYLSASSSTSPIRRATLGSISSPNTAMGISPTQSSINQQNDEKAVHVLHFIGLLHTALCNHYSPLNKKIESKDREILAKLQTELEFHTAALHDHHPSGIRSAARSSFSGPQRLSFSSSTSPSSAPLSPPTTSIPPVPTLPSAYLYSPSTAASQKRTSTTTVSAPPSPLESSPRSAHSRLPTTTSTEMSRVASQTSTVTTASSYKTSFSGSGRGGGGSGGAFEDSAGCDLVDVVRRLWGVDGDKLRVDLDGLRRAGLDEKTYLSDLKQHLIDLKADPSSASSTVSQDRIAALQAEITSLMHARPDLAGLALTSRSSVYTMASDSDSGSAHGSGGVHLFFTPVVNKEIIYKRLAERVYLLLDNDMPLVGSIYGERQLLDLCAAVWDVRGKNRVQFDAVAEIWQGSILKAQEDEERVGAIRRQRGATSQIEEEQNGWAQRVVEAIKELESDVSSGTLEDKTRESYTNSLASLSHFVLSETSKATSTLFPITAIPPLAPAPSVRYVAYTLFHSRALLSIYPEASRSGWSDAADELRAVAVSEYAMQTALFIQSNGDILNSQEQTEDGLKGYEELADWIACGVERSMKIWSSNVVDLLNPPNIILSKQLPLFLAELQAFDQPQPGRKADVIFGLYEKTARLLSLWEDVCPNTDCGFDMEAFFEPHVTEWLKTTEEEDTYEWVSRAVGMDSTSSAAVTQYASTVQNLFLAELQNTNASTPATEAAPAVSGKASAWLAKSKQAVKSLERKKAEAFTIPPTACVKITDLLAAKQCTEDLAFALDAEETSRIVKEHRLRTGAPMQRTGTDAKYDFHIVLGRGENLYAKNLATPADAFVSVFEAGNSTRLHKTSTVMSRIDPTWEEEFHHGVSSAKNLEINCFNRSLVGKNELIGSAIVKLDPVVYRETPLREIALPLNPRGTVHLRVELQTGDMHEVNYHLNKAKRMLDRVANDMIRNLVDKISEFVQMQLSVVRLRELIKPLTAKPKKGVSKPMTLTDEEYEQSLIPLFDYFDTCFATFNVTFPDALRIDVMSAIWKRVVEILLSLLIPPLSDKESHADPLSPQEVTVVFQWLKFSKSFFNASENGQEHGVPQAALKAGGYRDILLVGQYLDLPTPSLKDKCSAAIKSLRGTSRIERRGANGGATSESFENEGYTLTAHVDIVVDEDRKPKISCLSISPN
ncbi:hypothetical protein QFC19_002642 [Naganishia cerealis]|uniref:Uncharacterized protein n=1 Tax=Naganishia cerealis TaxID=610337 RepID=A0ACC2W9L2_9TREE|nr:hypothetical protein QFC19_002642 [Naganishia cerealis]